jgi:hypothetical protein
VKSFLLPIGSDRRLVTVANPGFRTGRQAAAVRRWVSTGEVAFACCDPFAVARGDRKPRKPRSFGFAFYDRHDRLVWRLVAPTGRVVREVRP